MPWAANVKIWQSVAALDFISAWGFEKDRLLPVFCKKQLFQKPIHTGKSNTFTTQIMNPVIENTALLNLHLRLAATPMFTFLKSDAYKQPNIAGAENDRTGFAFELDAFLQYNQLSATLTTYLRGTRLNISEGFIKKYVVIDGCRLYGETGQLVIETFFSGSFDGTIYFKGTPVYEPQTQTITLQNMTYELKTESFLLKSLKWLFYKLILDELKKYTVIEVATHRQKAIEALVNALNREWATGIQATGNVTALDITSIEAQQQQLLIGLRCNGDLHLTLSGLQLKI